MKRKRPAKQLPGAKSASSLDAQAIDALYGLEPIFEPDSVIASSAGLTPFVLLSCPYCGEHYETRIDLTNGACAYVEDCQVCCQPMELIIELNDANELQSVQARRLD